MVLWGIAMIVLSDHPMYDSFGLGLAIGALVTGLRNRWSHNQLVKHKSIFLSDEELPDYSWINEEKNQLESEIESYQKQRYRIGIVLFILSIGLLVTLLWKDQRPLSATLGALMLIFAVEYVVKIIDLYRAEECLYRLDGGNS